MKEAQETLNLTADVVAAATEIERSLVVEDSALRLFTDRLAVLKAGVESAVEQFIHEGEALIIADQATLDLAGVITKKATAAANDLDLVRTTLVKPDRERVDAINDALNPSIKKLGPFKKAMDGKIDKYVAELERQRLEQLRIEQEQRDAEAKKLERKADRAAERGDEETAADLRAQSAAASVPVGGPPPIIRPKTNARKTCKVYWVDRKGRRIAKPDMTLIPIEYHLPDESTLRNIGTASKGGTKIAGVEFVME